MSHFFSLRCQLTAARIGYAKGPALTGPLSFCCGVRRWPR